MYPIEFREHIPLATMDRIWVLAYVTITTFSRVYPLIGT